MPDREFLEEYPLYRKFVMELPGTVDKLDRPAIHMHCPVCGSDQTFRMHGEYYDAFDYANVPLNGLAVHVIYRCASCTNFMRHFLLKFDSRGRYVMKAGQDPPWDITPDPAVAKALGENSTYYKKGLVCESQGYGIGAFAYYRRIVEESIGDMLQSIADLVVGEELDRYLAALEKVKATPVAQEKIELVKDLLPPILRPGGMNPLSTLHGTLSEGLHQESDARCMELAMAVREVLVFLVNQLATTEAASSAFTESMRRLLERKASSGA